MVPVQDTAMMNDDIVISAILYRVAFIRGNPLVSSAALLQRRFLLLVSPILEQRFGG